MLMFDSSESAEQEEFLDPTTQISKITNVEICLNNGTHLKK